MPGPYTYPGVYIEEIPSGVHTIVGVATSNTAFVDYFSRGPMNQAVQITSYADFERTFGGLDSKSEASYGIMQYYLNGGQTAWVVRVADGNPQSATTTLQDAGSPPHDTLVVSAANEGEWGNNLRVAAVATNPPDPAVFNLVVQEVEKSDGSTRVVQSEAFFNLTMNKNDAQYALEVVNDGSMLVRLSEATGGLGALPATVTPDPITGAIPDKAFQQLSNGVDGARPTSADLLGDQLLKTGMYALDTIAPEIFNILCLPAAANLADAATTYVAAEQYCVEKRAFLIVDIPTNVTTKEQMKTWWNGNLGLHDHAAVYFPRLQVVDPLNANRLRNVGPSGIMAGVYARTDSTRGVWKAPAGIEASLLGAVLAYAPGGTGQMPIALTDQENGVLNPLGLNVLRSFPVFGNVSWGARTLDGADQKASDYKYIPVRRLALYIEESLYEGLKWVVFEPNDEPLWSQIRLNVGAFMQDLFVQHAFEGSTPREAYFVRCNSTTTTQTHIDHGIVIIIVGFAPLKPAEFVVIQLQQMAGQLQV